MFQRYSLVAALFLCATSLSAQTPPPAAPQASPVGRSTRPADERTTTRDGAHPTLTVEGCLVRESDVAAERPAGTERLDAGRDFVLANATITAGLPEAGAAGTAGTSGTQGARDTASGRPTTAGAEGTDPVGTTGLGTEPKAVEQTARTAQAAARATGHTFKVEGVGKEQLEPHAGTRVRVIGTAKDTVTGGSGDGRAFPKLEATTVTPIGGACSATRPR
jgi:hypothetical protein